MSNPKINDSVCLTHDQPDNWLHRGERGIVKSMWFQPSVAYEVEFRPSPGKTATRVILLPEEIRPDDLWKGQ